MSTDAPAKLPRKKRRFWRWFGFAILALAVAFLYQLFGPSKPVVVSREATYITEPLDVHGLPDYVEYYRRISRDGVTPENNAAVLIWQAIGPKPVPAELRSEFFAELGMIVPPDEGKYLTDIYTDIVIDAGAKWLEELNWLPPKPATVEGAEEEALAVERESIMPDAPWAAKQGRREWFERQIGNALERPWRTEELPTLAAWLDQNRVPLDLAVQASRRPRFYGSYARAKESDISPLLSMKICTEQEVRYLLRGLALRAMWHVGEGRLEAAYDDICACQRLTRLVSQSHFFLSQLVAQGMETTTTGCVNALCSRLHESPELCDRVRRDLEQLPPCSNVRRGIALDERLVALDTTIFSMQQIEAGRAGEGDDRFRRVPKPLRRASLDWPLILTRLNGAFDAIDLAATPGDISSDESRQILDKAYAFMEVEPDWKDIVGSYFSRRVRTDLMYHHMGNALAPFLVPFGNEKRHRSYHDLCRIAAALAAYRAAHGEYPAKLDQLAPDFLTNVPRDRDADAPLHYERRGGGFLLYGIGPNEKDDGGDDPSTSVLDGEWTNEKLDEMDFDRDYAIRIPIPPVQTPTQTTDPDAKAEKK